MIKEKILYATVEELLDDLPRIDGTKEEFVTAIKMLATLEVDKYFTKAHDYDEISTKPPLFSKVKNNRWRSEEEKLVAAIFECYLHNINPELCIKKGSYGFVIRVKNKTARILDSENYTLDNLRRIMRINQEIFMLTRLMDYHYLSEYDDSQLIIIYFLKLMRLQGVDIKKYFFIKDDCLFMKTDFGKIITPEFEKVIKAYLDVRESLENFGIVLPGLTRQLSAEAKKRIVDAYLPDWKEGGTSEDDDGRHTKSMEIARMMCWEGYPIEICLEIITEIVEKSGDKELRDRIRAVKDSYNWVEKHDRR